ncbi:uncharacterized protein LOC115718736 [Cannabis sativa]|uniref:uncharacterized protein LOC115718736 n=1 Tax=Cannabis sativa TaxID=3483 RepID=UPI0029C9BD98|nr:uncharacterized protein LOC115718736 [Cannabis sativa]XP_060964621.1 uncharacterized protein LOC115718736 [Cannabis sativa]XP_060964622.1 uncharacterized protein LOC115718736 [Cannabis sativa]XP_060964623.1 uncharacterized protein LOC115718736 [Cannabis sativa]
MPLLRSIPNHLQTSADNNNNRAQSPAPPPVQQTQPDRPAYEDIRSPYYLSNADHPGLVLATRILTDRNFQPWRRDFKISIGARNKTPFLEGILPQPPPNDSLFGSCIRCNQMVMSWILHSISPEIKSSIMYLDTAAEMWTVLHNRFNQGNGPRIFELNETLTYLHQGEDSLSSYFTKLTTIWDEIHQLRPKLPCTCAAATQSQDHTNHDQVLQFLKGLNETYHAVRDQLLLLDPCPPLNKVFSMTVNQERQRTIGHRTIPTFAATATSTPAANKTDPAPAANQTSRNKKPCPMCTHCQKSGHYKDKCYFFAWFSSRIWHSKAN